MKKLTILVAALLLGIGVSAPGETAAEGKLPKKLSLGSLSKVYEPVPFNHEDHVSAAGECAVCHHQHGEVQVKNCVGCHQMDSAAFKKSVNTAMFKPCGECHAPTDKPEAVGLKTAYHRACFKCHKEDVGGGVKNLSGCTEMCHALKAPGKKSSESNKKPR